MLYRAALVECRAAERFSRSRLPERRLQEADACASAIILAMSSLEGWINSACRPHGIKPENRDGWFGLWSPETLRRIGALREHPTTADQHPPAHVATYLRYMRDLRNYLVHGDARSRDRVAKWLNREPSSLLSVWVAQTALDDVDTLFRNAMAMTGILAPTKMRILEIHPKLLK